MDPTTVLDRLPPAVIRQIASYILPEELSFGGKWATTATRYPENPLLSLIRAIPPCRGVLDKLLFETCRFGFEGFNDGESFRCSSEVAIDFFRKVGFGKIYLVKWLQLNPLSRGEGWINEMERSSMLSLLRLLVRSPRLGHHKTELPRFIPITAMPVFGSTVFRQPWYYGLQESSRPRLIVSISPQLRDWRGRFLRSLRIPLNELNLVLHLHNQNVYPVDFTTELPLELRRIIYVHLMSDAPIRCEVTEQGIRSFGQNNGFASYLRINQDVHYELSELLYRNCLFHFQHTTNAEDWNRANKIKDTAPWCANFLNSIGKDKASNIRHVLIELTISEDHPHYTPPVDSLMNELLMRCDLEFGAESQYVEYRGSAVQDHTRIFYINLGKLTRGRVQFQVRTPWTWPHTVPFRRSGRLQIDVVMKVLDAAVRGLNCAVTTRGRVTTR
ncbi:MAG: hypothetical protein Q9187_007902 [Circinaria calcarea]